MIFEALLNDPTHYEKRIQKILKEEFQTKFNVSRASLGKLRRFQSHLTNKQNVILKESHFNNYHNNPEYIKNVLMLDVINKRIEELI